MAKSKFEPKMLLWIVISEDGISSPILLTCKTGMSIKTDFTISKCLRPNILPFLSTKTNRIFWPDLASAQYSTKILEQLWCEICPKSNKHCRPLPIKDLFGALATKVYAGNWVAKNIPALVARIRRCVREFPLQVVHWSTMSTPTMSTQRWSSCTCTRHDDDGTDKVTKHIRISLSLILKFRNEFSKNHARNLSK